jgi:hypothetical protein
MDRVSLRTKIKGESSPSEELVLLRSSLSLRPVLLQLGIGSVESRNPFGGDACGADGAVLDALPTVRAKR